MNYIFKYIYNVGNKLSTMGLFYLKIEINQAYNLNTKIYEYLYKYAKVLTKNI